MTIEQPTPRETARQSTPETFDPESGEKIVCWFSCGLTSATAAKLMIDEYGHENVEVVYADPGSEPPDNARFLKECEEWFEQPITIIRSEKYADTWDVWERTKWLVGPMGVRCSPELKKIPCRKYMEGREDDPQVFGFDPSETKRIAKYRENNIGVNLWTPLHDRGITKADCAKVVMRAGIEIPLAYRQGFSHANCTACPQGGQSHWNRVRRHYPDQFDRMAKLERTLDVAINKTYADDGERKRVFLDELDPDAGRDEPETSFECGLLCGFQEELF